ncbi:hypothetical protein Hamer_G000488 [Homarus americanus]|uniref:Uncharacterized protein n=1 Tax=Homarus americanus TaxID=6706 RepID=A0A8J5NCK8_HOMAM|nr:hypothetical protein Hamer_G000488 [Homarus americanus]
MPPILNPQTSLVVAEAHMGEAGTSHTPHLSSTSHPGTARISAKRNRGSSESLEMSAKAGASSSEMPTDPLPEVSGDETQTKIGAGT